MLRRTNNNIIVFILFRGTLKSVFWIQLNDDSGAFLLGIPINDVERLQEKTE